MYSGGISFLGVVFCSSKSRVEYGGGVRTNEAVYENWGPGVEESVCIFFLSSVRIVYSVQVFF